MGSQALDECLPPELWEILVATAGDPGPGMGVFDERLRQLMHEFGNEGTDPANGTHAVSRVTLRRLLLAGLDDVVSFDKEFVRYERSADGKAIAFFTDGTSAAADVLVGADGARSRVRRQYLPHARTIDLPGIGVAGKLPLNEETISRSRTLRTTARIFFRLCGVVPPLRRAIFEDE
jgi:2-polyprenyl-6-methoxyphenol hydroxylase-like FAD-dependent oxidoreductase